MDLEKELQTDEFRDFCQAILSLKNEKELSQFLRDVATLREMRDMAERFAVVKMLSQKIPYRQIAEKTGVSTATITRIAHWLHHGTGGYKLVLGRLHD